MIKKLCWWVAASQVVVLGCSLLFYRRIDLLSYINTSFVAGGLLLLAAMTGFIINTGFFDVIFFSFQRFYYKSGTDIRPLSKLIPFRFRVPFLTGLIMMILMLIALSLQK
ncbi:DUF3899 domain-containing protein [Heyndrickxia acidiproducens]|uniref:DUF3899 domain-containing protein n=1 Tax=Heyndrickxia acidiproducens TaxID=1121084 RepID=UPI00036381AD|nr:DUF3899 domain-containing protein [Heyndrickxia acidiproducens]